MAFRFLSRGVPLYVLEKCHCSTKLLLIFTVFSRSTKNRLLSIVFDMCLHTFDTKQQKSKQYIFSRWFLILVAGIQHAVWATVNAIIHRRYNRLLAFRKTFLLFCWCLFVHNAGNDAYDWIWVYAWIHTSQFNVTSSELRKIRESTDWTQYCYSTQVCVN